MLDNFIVELAEVRGQMLRALLDNRSHIYLQGLKIHVDKRKHLTLLDGKCAWCGVTCKYVEVKSNRNGTANISFPVTIGKWKRSLTIDHINAKSNGGAPRALENFQVLCELCNGAKGTAPSGTKLITWDEAQTLLEAGKAVAASSWSGREFIMKSLIDGKYYFHGTTNDKTLQRLDYRRNQKTRCCYYEYKL